MRRRWQVLPPDIRRQIMMMAAKGATYDDILEQMDVSVGTITKVTKPLGGVYRVRQRSPRRLSADDRVEIYLGIERGWSYRKIAASIGRHASTVCREVNHNGGRAGYRPLVAERSADQRARRPKPTKLAKHPELCRRVTRDLQRLWSPQQIARRLRDEFGDDPTMTISHETIYQSIYVQGRGELRRELARCLRTGRAKRKPRGREHRGRIRDMVMISQRPAEIEDRAVPGHWEGDLILGRNGRSQIGTLVERTTRFVMLLHLPEQRTAAAVEHAMAAAITTLPDALFRSITWDQGIELAGHRRFTLATGVQVYFCDPHAPWQRGSNENTNGLLRQYFPKDTDLSVHTPADLQAAADSLNERPRQTLGWKTPSEKLAELLVASTA
ncbi:MAG TPA: IS30 family transposase [Egibacteraceae bacterium]|nr:IS30 family transposase [Egibacteraceae bacterium]